MKYHRHPLPIVMGLACVLAVPSWGRTLDDTGLANPTNPDAVIDASYKPTGLWSPQGGPEPAGVSALDTSGTVFDDPQLMPAQFSRPIPPGPTPPDPNGPVRMMGPTPVAGHHFYGVPNTNLNTRPDAHTYGIRLDNSYWLPAEYTVGYFGTEYAQLVATGPSGLIFQAPGWVLGLRGMVGAVDNGSISTDSWTLHLDTWVGTRYKRGYHKIGAFWDRQDDFTKVGAAYSAFANLPIIGPWTFDGTWAWGTGGDIITPPRNANNLRLRRVEGQDFDMQLRVGHWFTPYFQLGGSGHYFTMAWTKDEWSAGAFATLYLGRLRITSELAGGDEGLRGFATASFDFGKPRARRPQDINFVPYDTVRWLARPTLRDAGVVIRESATGPLPPQTFVP